MTNRILQNILQKRGEENLIEFLSEKLSNSELNSLLLEVFQKRTANTKASELLKNYQTNRFVAPANIDPIAFREFELKILKFIQKSGFEIFESSPLSPLGTSSVIAKVHQNNVISASRGTEVLSDITNVMALEIAKRKANNRQLQNINLCAAPRQVRGQLFDFEGFTPHFKILGLTSAGRDLGNYKFEIGSMANHLHLYIEMFNQVLGITANKLKIHFEIFPTQDNLQYLTQVYQQIIEILPQIETKFFVKSKTEFEYYQNIRFKFYFKKGENWMEIGDGGFVNWTQQLLQNRKERLLISGIGTEFLFKIL